MANSHSEENGVSERSPLIQTANDSEGELEADDYHGTACCDPRLCLHRYFPILFLICFLSFGSYFCYDNPAALQDNMLHDLNIEHSEYMAFYSFYSWPNVILCMFGGFLIDRVFGLRMGSIVFSLFVTVGQVIYALGALLDMYWLMCLGRFVFGVGGESLAVAQNTFAVHWFKGKELNLVFGLQLSFSRVGSTVNMDVMNPLYNFTASLDDSLKDYQVLGLALFFGAGMCIFSLICAFFLAFFDKRADRIMKREPVSAEEKIKFRDILTFPAAIWAICIICVAYYVAVFPFIGIGQDFFISKYGLDVSDANAVNSIVYIVSAVASPVFGLCIDLIGFNVFWVITGTFFTLACHACMTFLTSVNPYVPMVIMGLAYSVLASALWPMVSLIIPTTQLGTAYGIMQAVQNLGLAVISLLVGVIVDKYGYNALEYFFMGWLGLALVSGFGLWILDKSRGGSLNFSAKKRALERTKAEEDARLLEEEENRLRATEEINSKLAYSGTPLSNPVA